MTLYNALTTTFIAFGLSMDCFAVSLSTGISNHKLAITDFIRIAFFFGFFQGAMPVLGWLLGSEFREAIANYDHWLAFIVLFLLGLKMIYESLPKKGEEKKESNILKFHILIGLSIATSLDALAVGLSFAFLNMPIMVACMMIGFITFNMSMLGMRIGQRFGKSFKFNAELIGGVTLIIIGFNILFNHLH